MSSFNPCPRQMDAFPSIAPGTPMIMNPTEQMLQTGLPTLPTGMPTGPSLSGTTPVPATGATLGGSPIAPSTLTNPAFIPGFLRTQIGQRVRVEFLIGTGTTTDRIGTLVGVGASYILILLQETDDILMADLFSIKFVTFYH